MNSYITFDSISTIKTLRTNQDQIECPKTPVIKKLINCNLEIIKQDQGIIDLNFKINRISELLRADLTNSFASSATDQEKKRYFLSIKNEVKCLNEKFAKFNPVIASAVIAKYTALKQCDTYINFLEDLINYQDHVISIFEGKKDREFYVKYAEYEKERNRWRTEVFDKLINWNECVENPAKHPEWPFFLNQMQKHINDKVTIEKIWNLTILGIECQLSVKDANHKGNIHFEELAHLLMQEGLLSLNPNEYLAFWCGGFDLSIFAQQSEYTTLEKTKAGRIFDVLMLYPHFAPLVNLWNHLSCEFTKLAGKTVHVFFRIHDPMSVFEREELIGIKALGTVEKLIFHPMINSGDTIQALGIEELHFNQGENAKDVLKNFLVNVCQKAIKHDTKALKLHKANIRAISEMKLD